MFELIFSSGSSRRWLLCLGSSEYFCLELDSEAVVCSGREDEEVIKLTLVNGSEGANGYF
jgi:hypothetical protein